jgi:DNA-binding protein YbaB
MAYQIKSEAGQHQVVVTMNGGKTVVRVVDSSASLSDAERLLRDLAGWRF